MTFIVSYRNKLIHENHIGFIYGSSACNIVPNWPMISFESLFKLTLLGSMVLTVDSNKYMLLNYKIFVWDLINTIGKVHN